MGRRPASAPTHRAVRPRYGRICMALTSLGITAIAVLGAAGVLPGVEGAPAAAEPGAVEPAAPAVPHSSGPEHPLRLSRGATQEGAAGMGDAPPSDALPADSGRGRRVVFDMTAQRVWLVDGSEQVRRTYLVSGSVTDNLRPGTYEVYSTSRHAVGVDDSGTMEYMVRFARGERAAIGFHDIPVKDGELVQSRDELGTPRSHGCIRQWRPDARALWRFAKVGTTVVVTD